MAAVTTSTPTTPTAPLSAAASEALAAQLMKSRVRAAELADLGGAGHKLSALEWDDLAHAEDLMAGARASLEQAGRLDLIGGAL